MGLFLSLSGVIGRDAAAVVDAMRSYTRDHAGSFEPATDAKDPAIVTETDGNTTIVYPSRFTWWDDVSMQLSAALQTPVFSFHIHDGDCWTLVLFQQGKRITQFNPIPEYWGELDALEKASWAGDATAISQCIPGVSEDSIKNYFVEWTDEMLESGEKAYPDDTFPYGRDWQLTDFMRRVGLTYPIDDKGIARGQKFRLNAIYGRR